MILSRRLFGLIATVIAIAVVMAAFQSAPGQADVPPSDAVPQRPVIAAYERFHAAAPSAAAGRLLIGELSCTACHPAGAVDAPPQSGPRLDGVGTRIEVDWLRQFLADPQATKPGTTMPHMLSALPAAERADAVESLVHFLASSKGSIGKPPKLPANTSFDRGSVLFHEIGCVACHAPAPDYRPPNVGTGLAATRITGSAAPLPDLKRKYSLESLMQFLCNPLDHRPSGRMPDLMLDPQDAVDLAAYLIGWNEVLTTRSGVPTKFNPMKVDPRRVAAGRTLFASLRCASCHQLDGNQPTDKAAKLADLTAFDRGCVGPAPTKGVPYFALSAGQRQSIAMAIKSDDTLSAAQRVALTMERLNCYACHRRDDRGGPDKALEPYLSGDPDLADEGRFPPALTGVGRKLTPQWLAKVLGREGRMRPYLRTRMPVFAADTVKHLPADFIAADGGMKADAEKVLAGGDVEAGRLLLGGNGLSCITCHPIADKPSIGIHAMTLSGMPDRLQPDWFRQNLLNPAALRPGTLMPTFWPDGKAANADILHGDTERQIASIWAYLRDGKGPPDGHPPARGEFELVAEDRAVLLRCFMKGAGTHAIAVGFPQKVHFAFDANDVRPAIAWRGRFLDAYSTWFSRAQPPVEPLGENVIPLPPAMPLAKLASPDAQWPVKTGADAGYTFKGYRLDKAGVPTFLYSFADLSIEDRLMPTEDGKGLRRTLVVRGNGKDIYYNHGTTPGLRVQVHQLGLSKPETLHLVRFDNGVATLNVEYRW